MILTYKTGIVTTNYELCLFHCNKSKTVSQSYLESTSLVYSHNIGHTSLAAGGSWRVLTLEQLNCNQEESRVGKNYL